MSSITLPNFVLKKHWQALERCKVSTGQDGDRDGGVWSRWDGPGGAGFAYCSRHAVAGML